jgi:hypothetical protein
MVSPTLRRAEAVMVHATLRRATFAGGKRLIIWVSVMAAIALTAGLMQTGTGHSLLQKLGLSGTAADYTALAFTNPKSLPAHLSPRPAKMKLSFDVTNSSAGPRSYNWSMALERGGRNTRLAAGEISVPAGSRLTVARTVKASCAKGRARLIVKIAAPAESIDFWMACSPRKAGKP